MAKKKTKAELMAAYEAAKKDKAKRDAYKKTAKGKKEQAERERHAQESRRRAERVSGAADRRAATPMQGSGPHADPTSDLVKNRRELAEKYLGNN